MKKIMIALTVSFMVTFPFQFAYGAETGVIVSIPSFPVTLNELRYDDNDYVQYPMLVYKDITYFPMTFYKSNLMNLNTNWTTAAGLVIARGNPETPKVFLYEGQGGSRNNRTQSATIVSSKVTVNGKVIDNQREPYPLLRFRDITYFPLTWRFAVEEFGWSYTFNHADGLNISADNYFFNGNSSTAYIKGDVKILLDTTFNRLGPTSGNLHIIKNGEEKTPIGYFGYYQESGPLFSVEGDIIHTTQIIGGDFNLEENHEARQPIPCRINIETGEVF